MPNRAAYTQRARPFSRVLGVVILVSTLGSRAAHPVPPQPGSLTPSSLAKVPGVVISHSPQSSGLYIGSPSLTVLNHGDYLASHDLFGPQSQEHERPTTRVFRSTDRGVAWEPVASIQGLFWATLFTHANAAYLLGTDRHHGRIVIRRSQDAGRTWTEPRDASTGLLTAEGQFHTAPVPIARHGGRLWRGFEDAMGGTEWGKRYRVRMLSVPEDANLLDASRWTLSTPLPRNGQWLQGDFNAWLEGNAVVTRDGHLVNILRVDTSGLPEKAAIVDLGPDGKAARFDPTSGFIDFPGGAKKFTIRFDPASGRYWSLTSIVPRSYGGKEPPARIRNTLALIASSDLRQWEIHCILLHHPDPARHGFQYPDWLFDGDDLIAVVRTAFDDEEGGAHNNHDANFLTFHRFRNFRRLTPADSVPVP